jgi:hypothetical protein
MESNRIFKVNLLRSNNTIEKIIIYHGINFKGEKENLEFYFDKNEWEKIQNENIQIVSSNQQIHLDDTIYQIKLKILKEFKIESIEDIYLFCKSEDLFYISFLQSFFIDKSKKTQEEFISLIKNIQNEKIQTYLKSNNPFTIDTLLSLQINNSIIQVNKTLGNKSIFQEHVHYPVNPFDLSNNEKHLIEKNKKIDFNDNDFLFVSEKILDNTIYLCIANDLKKENPQFIEFYFPKKNMKNEYDKIKPYIDNIDYFYNLYYNQKTPIVPIENGVVSIYGDFLHYPLIHIPLEHLFKLIHSDKNIPIMKYNPSSKRDKIFRFWTNNQLLKSGDKIPFVNKAMINKVLKIMGKSKSLSFFIQTNDMFYSIFEIDENATISFRILFDNPKIISEVNEYIKVHMNLIINKINTILIPTGNSLFLFTDINDFRVQIKKINYQYTFKIKKKFEINKIQTCFSSVFVNQTSSSSKKDDISLLFKKVSHFINTNAQESYVIQKIKEGISKNELVSLLVQNFQNEFKNTETAYPFINNLIAQLELKKGVRHLEIKNNQGFKTMLNIDTNKSELQFTIENIDNIYYLQTLPIYIYSFIIITQNKENYLPHQIIQQNCNNKKLIIPEQNEKKIINQSKKDEKVKIDNIVDNNEDDNDADNDKYNFFLDEDEEEDDENENNDELKGGVRFVEEDDEDSIQSVSTASASLKSNSPNEKSIASKSSPDEKSIASLESVESSPDEKSIASLESSPEKSIASLESAESLNKSPEDKSIASLESVESLNKSPEDKSIASLESVESLDKSPEDKSIESLDKSVEKSIASLESVESLDKSPIESVESNSPEKEESNKVPEDDEEITSMETTDNEDSIASISKNKDVEKEKEEEEKENKEDEEEEKEEEEEEKEEEEEDSIISDNKTNKSKRTESDKESENEIMNIDFMDVKKKNPYWQSRIEKLDPELILKEDSGKFHSYSRVCSSSVRRQPVIVTDKELEKINKSNPGFLKKEDVITYGTDKNKKFNYICPRYWCLKNNTIVNPKDLKEVMVNGKKELMSETCGYVLPKDAKKVKPGYYIYEFYKPNTLEEKDFKRYPGFQTDKHPKGYCLPCCFDKYNTLGRMKALNQCNNNNEKKNVEENENKNKKENEYIKRSETFPILSKRWGYIPFALQMLLREFSVDCQVSNTNTNLKKNTPCLLRHGIEQDKHQSFLSCIADILYFQINKEEGNFIQKVKNNILKSIHLEMFLRYQNGNLMNYFLNMKNEFDKIPEINMDKYKHNQNDKERQYIQNKLYAFEIFKLYIQNATTLIDHTIMWDIISEPNPLLFKNGVNIILFEIPNNDITNNIEIVCPSNHYSNQFYDSKKPSIFLVKQYEYYEPIYYYKQHDKETTIIKEFKEDDMQQNIPNTISFLLKKVMKKIYDSHCKPKPSLPNKYKMKSAILLSDILISLKKSNYKIIHQVMNFHNKVIGILVKNVENDKVMLPCYPSSMHKDLSIVFMNDLMLWNTYEKTIFLLNEISETLNLPVKPMYNVIEDKLVVGILTETNQFIQTTNPFDIKESNVLYPSIKNLNYVIKGENVDVVISNSNKKDEVRMNYIQNVKNNTNYFILFRNTIRVFMQNYENYLIYSKIKDELKKEYKTYSVKLNHIIYYLKELTIDKLKFVDNHNHIELFHPTLKECTPQSKEFCFEITKETSQVIEKNIVFPKTNSLTGENNEEFFYKKVADEMIRYSQMKSFYFELNSYYYFGQNIFYLLNSDELLLFESLLSEHPLFKLNHLEIMNQSNYLNSYDEIQPNNTQKYNHSINYNDFISKIESSQNESEQNTSEQNESAQNKSAQNESAQNESAQNKSAQNESAQNEFAQNESAQNESAQNEFAQNEIEQNEIEQNEIEQNEIEQNEIEQNVNKIQNESEQKKKNSKNKKIRCKKGTRKNKNGDCVQYQKIKFEIIEEDEIDKSEDNNNIEENKKEANQIEENEKEENQMEDNQIEENEKEENKSQKKKFKRCPKGTRKNNKNGDCVPIQKIKFEMIDDNEENKSPKKKFKRCPKGTRKNKKNGDCVPNQKINFEIIEDNEENISPFRMEENKIPKKKFKRCPKGTRKNKKNGDCVPNQKINFEIIEDNEENISPFKMEENKISPLRMEENKSPKKKFKRCPKGTRKNKKNGDCVPNQKINFEMIEDDEENISPLREENKSPKKKKYERCPKGTRKNKNGDCVPYQKIYFEIIEDL